jgi:transposase
MDGMQEWPAEAIQVIMELKQEIEGLKKRISELENKLRQYENPHSPSSMQRFKNNISKGNPPGKRGAPRGHRGATRKTPRLDEIIPVPADVCPGCGQHPGESRGMETVTIEELPPPRKIKVTRYELHRYTCPGCGLSFTTRHQDCPNHGRFGIGVLTEVTMLRFHLRGVLRRIQDSLWYLHDFDLTAQGVNDVLFRVAQACKQEYVRLVHRIQDASWRHIDETSSRVNGKNWWLWNFRTNTDESLVVIRDSRGGGVLDEVLGDDCQGGHVTDGWKVYWKLDNVQRCWAHLIREVDSNKQVSEEGAVIAKEIHQRFHLLKEFLDKGPPMVERRRMKEQWDQELKDLVERYDDSIHTRHLVTYLKNGLGCWHTCLLYPGMPPTNNLGEQAIREHVIIRKIIGSFRSVEGCEYYQYIVSMFATWRFQGKNIMEELEKLLRKELCLS